MLMNEETDSSKHADVLLVDDQRINLIVAAKLIEQAGFTCETAANAEEALELLRSRAYRLLLLDMQLPDMSGLDLVRHIRGEDGGSMDLSKRRMPIAILSAFAADEDRRASFEAGADEYLTKPINREMLSDVFQRLMPNTASPREPTDATRADAGNGAGDRGDTDGPAEAGKGGDGEAGDTTTLPVFDSAGLEARVGSASLSQTVASRFIESLDNYVTAVDKAAASDDLTALRSAAHNLASPAGNVGAEALRALMKSCETAAYEGKREEAHHYASRLHAEADAAREEIERFISEKQTS